MFGTRRGWKGHLRDLTLFLNEFSVLFITGLLQYEVRLVPG